MKASRTFIWTILSYALLLYGQDVQAQNETITKSEDKTSAMTSSDSIPSSGSNRTAKPTTGTIDGHEFVDLGLSVKWATCNVGASSPSDYGDYYAWGETSTKSSYDTGNCSTRGESKGNIAGNPEYDVATANWGSPWRLPTRDEIDELILLCKREWTTMDGHYGYKVTGPNGNSIFLPASGYREGKLLTAAGHGHYWSAMPSLGLFYYAYGLGFNEFSFTKTWTSRSYGYSVRPVTE